MRKKIYEDTKERFKVYAERHKERVLLRSREWNQKNREKRNAVSKAWRERNKEKMAEIKRVSKEKHPETELNYRKRNKDRLNEKAREWALKNPEKRKETFRAYRKRNPNKVLDSSSLRRARINKGKIIRFTAKQLKERLSVYGGKCWMCGSKADQIDHVLPLAKGGPHILSNLRPACGPCNRKKSDKIIKKPLRTTD
jgi:5-methylcytosine-specific restriction endonuclease McrA